MDSGGDDPQEGRRASDREEWRGQISERVRSHDRRLTEQNVDLRELRKAVDRMRDEMTQMAAQVLEARNDIGETIASMGKSRDQEITDLRTDIKDTKVSTRDLLLTVAFPIAVLVIGALIVTLIIGHGKMA